MERPTGEVCFQYEIVPMGCMCRPHNPSDLEERARISAAGGRVTLTGGRWRVQVGSDGLLATIDNNFSSVGGLLCTTFQTDQLRALTINAFCGWWIQTEDLTCLA